MTSSVGFFNLHTASTPVQILSLGRLASGLGNYIAPALFSQSVFGFSQRRPATAAQASTTAPKPASPEELTVGLRLLATRDVALGLLLRDSSSVVVERALQAGFISSILDLSAAAFGFVEGSLSQEITSAVGITASVLTLFQAYILYY